MSRGYMVVPVAELQQGLGTHWTGRGALDHGQRSGRLGRAITACWCTQDMALPLHQTALICFYQPSPTSP